MRALRNIGDWLVANGLLTIAVLGFVLVMAPFTVYGIRLLWHSLWWSLTAPWSEISRGGGAP